MRILLRSKIHRATVTGCNPDYSSSITLPRDLLEAADIAEFEQVHVLDVDNGERLVTYAIAGDDSGLVYINGAAARKVNVGDKIIILAYEVGWEAQQPKIVKVDDSNRICGDVRC